MALMRTRPGEKPYGGGPEKAGNAAWAAEFVDERLQIEPRFEQANHDFASEIKPKRSIEPPGFWAPRRCARPARGRRTPDRWNQTAERSTAPWRTRANRGAVPRALGTSSGRV